MVTEASLSSLPSCSSHPLPPIRALYSPRPARLSTALYARSWAVAGTEALLSSNGRGGDQSLLQMQHDRPASELLAADIRCSRGPLGCTSGRVEAAHRRPSHRYQVLLPPQHCRPTLCMRSTGHVHKRAGGSTPAPHAWGSTFKAITSNARSSLGSTPAPPRQSMTPLHAHLVASLRRPACSLGR